MELTKWDRDKFNWNRGPEAANAPGVYRGQIVRVDQDPLHHCYPAGLVRLGPPRNIIVGGRRGVLIEFLQTPGKVILLFQYHHEVRQIWMYGRGHSEDPDPTWMGHSIGWWDGDTLVVDTIGLNDKTWIDAPGHPHTEEMHVVERYRRVDQSTLEVDLTFDDPKAYTEPWKGQFVFKLEPDWEIMESVFCVDRERFATH